jgi:hypothetical protein
MNRIDIADEPLLCGCGATSDHTINKVGLCCACYVAAGNPPADWHLGCMAAFREHLRLPDVDSQTARLSASE